MIRIYRAVTDGVFFLGWNKPLAGALAADGRRQLSEWVGQALPSAGLQSGHVEGRVRVEIRGSGLRP